MHTAQSGMLTFGARRIVAAAATGRLQRRSRVPSAAAVGMAHRILKDRDFVLISASTKNAPTVASTSHAHTRMLVCRVLEYTLYCCKILQSRVRDYKGGIAILEYVLE